jgi:hypothetical protein
MFDVIVALDVVEHISPGDCGEVLEMTRSRLKSGGRLILRTPNADCPLVLPTYHGDLTHKTLFSHDLTEHISREAGFKGPIEFWETALYRRVKRAIYLLLHKSMVRPSLRLLYYHFYNRFSRVITRNMYCAAWA